MQMSDKDVYNRFSTIQVNPYRTHYQPLNDLSMVQHQSIETSWNMWNKMTEKHTKKSKELFKELTVD